MEFDMYERTCAECKTPFAGTRRDARFCCKRCSNNYTRKNNPRACGLPDCDRPHRAKGLCAFHWRQQFGLHDIDCATCGETFRAYRESGKYCSEECKGAAYSVRLRAREKLPASHPVMVLIADAKVREAAERAKMREAQKLQRLSTWRTARHCSSCGVEFSPLYSPLQETCSRACARANGRRDRRARIGDSVEVVHWRAVLARDGSTCYLCGYDVDPTDFRLLPGSDGRDAFVAGLEYPTVDHVVPLARGGAHAMSNARLAHLYCNSMKCDQPLDAVA